MNEHPTNLGIYKIRSAMTNPTLKNMLDAGKNGTTRNRSPIARLLCDVPPWKMYLTLSLG